MSWHSDRKSQRFPFIFASLLVILVGFVICIVASSRGSQGAVYAGVFIATCGVYPAGTGVIVWLANNLAGSYKRSAGMAIQLGFGNLSGGRFSPSHISLLALVD